MILTPTAVRSRASKGQRKLQPRLGSASHFSTVTAGIDIAPRHDRSICQDGSKSPKICGLDVHNVFRSCTSLLSPPYLPSPQVTADPSARTAAKALSVLQPWLNGIAVTAKLRVAPGHHGAICQNGRERTNGGLDLLYSLELLLDVVAVTAKPSIAPRNHRTIGQDGSISFSRGLDLLHIFQLSLNSTAVTAAFGIAPTDDRFVSQDGSESLVCAWMCCTLFSFSCTAVLLPPKAASPQVTTEPSARIEAKVQVAPHSLLIDLQGQYVLILKPCPLDASLPVQELSCSRPCVPSASAVCARRFTVSRSAFNCTLLPLSSPTSRSTDMA